MALPGFGGIRLELNPGWPAAVPAQAGRQAAHLMSVLRYSTTLVPLCAIPNCRPHTPGTGQR
jgi:hypothetical protein